MRKTKGELTRVEAGDDHLADGKGSVDADDPGAPLSRRVRKKAEKLQRIKDASQALFLTKGFDDTTTREIAHIAGVALGTLFTYADNKRDLLFLICNDGLEAAIIDAERMIRPNSSLLDNIVMIAQVHFSHFAMRPEISRFALREMYFYAAGKQVERFTANRDHLMGLFQRMIEVSAANGVIRLSENSGLIASAIFAVYQAEVRACLDDGRPDPDAATDRFTRKIRILLTGLNPRDEALALTRYRLRGSSGQ